MEQLPALSTVLCIVLFNLNWGAGIPAGCKRADILNAGASIQKPGGLRVSQEPRSLNVTAGEAVTMSCSFQYKEGMRVKVLWIRGSGEDVVLDSNHPFYRGRLNVSSVDEVRQGKAMLTLSQLEERDVGLYYCCIEIYTQETGMGRGTELRVMQRIQSVTDNGKESQLELSRELNIYRAMIALAAVGIILLAGMIVVRRRKAAATETEPQQSAKRGGRSASNTNENLHYAEVTLKAPAHTEYASVRTQRP